MKLLHTDITSRALGLTLGLRSGNPYDAITGGTGGGQCSDPVRVRYNTELS